MRQLFLILTASISLTGMTVRGQTTKPEWKTFANTNDSLKTELQFAYRDTNSLDIKLLFKCFNYCEYEISGTALKNRRLTSSITKTGKKFKETEYAYIKDSVRIYFYVPDSLSLGIAFHGIYFPCPKKLVCNNYLGAQHLYLNK